MSSMSVRQRRSFVIDFNQILFLIGGSGELGIVKVGKNKEIFMGMPNGEEVVMFLGPEDLIVASAFDVGGRIERGLKYMLYLLREMDTPLVVLSENHPTSKRLPMVVAAGERIRLDCNITPGTHPEQDILCACPDLSGMEIIAVDGGIEIMGVVDKFKIEEF